MASKAVTDEQIYDLFVIGGGINGTGIARDAAGRGLTVALAEMDDLAQATSSSSTKLFHGGLRYLEYFEFSLVRKALIERETLLRAMPHISWPMRFVLPMHEDMRFENDTPTSKLISAIVPWMKGRRPNWLIRLGLFMYDHLGGREILPGTKTLNLKHAPEGKSLKAKFQKAFEYSDCWVEDSRLVVLNARDADERGADIFVRTKVTSAEREDDHWKVTTKNQLSGKTKTHRARIIINAGGPWVEDIIRGVTRINSSEGVRLVRGSHIVTRKLFEHDKAYFFQGSDGRIIFAIPYETDFTLIGTTDQEHDGAPGTAECTQQERDYLCAFASNYFDKPITAEDIVWTYSGVRPLYDDGAKSATAATRDYVLSVNDENGPPVLNVFGGKITTYRKLAEQVIKRLEDYLPDAQKDWTAGVPMPGGDFPVDGFEDLVSQLAKKHSYITPKTVRRLVRAYGTEAALMLEQANSVADLGADFGAGLYEVEVRHLMEKEYAITADDVVWRRSKLGLRMSESQMASLDEWMSKQSQIKPT